MFPRRMQNGTNALKHLGSWSSSGIRVKDWPLEPKTACYDWLYYNAARNTLSEEKLEQMTEYDVFTDIEYNAAKSINTQARSAALVVTIYL